MRRQVASRKAEWRNGRITIELLLKEIRQSCRQLEEEVKSLLGDSDIYFSERVAIERFKEVSKWAKSQNYVSITSIQRRFRFSFLVALHSFELLNAKRIIRKGSSTFIFPVVKTQNGGR